MRAKRRRDLARNVAFLSPWLLGTGLFFLYPLAATVYFSFTKYDGFTPPVFDGLDNWTYVFTNYPFFWPALRNTLWLVVVMVTLRVIFGLGLGLLITKIKTGAGVLRTLFYLPYLAPPVAATMAFAFLLNPGTGPVNTILGKLGLPQPGWFNDPAWSKPALTLLALWGIGDLMVIFMAALLDVPTPAVRGGRARRRGRRGSGSATSRCRTSRRSCCSRWSPASSRRCSTTRSRWSPGRSPAG